MTKFIKLILCLLCLCSFLAFGAAPNTEGKEKVTRAGVTLFLEPNSPLKQEILKGNFDKSLEAMKEAYAKSKDKPQVAAEAPAVWAVRILQVYSTQGGLETVVGKSVTDKDHGGSVFQVSTCTYGYGGGNYDSATFNGSTATQLQSSATDLNNDGIADGFLDFWDISKPPYDSGTFVFKAMSVNVGPTLSTQIQIK